MEPRHPKDVEEQPREEKKQDKARPRHEGDAGEKKNDAEVGEPIQLPESA